VEHWIKWNQMKIVRLMRIALAAGMSTATIDIGHLFHGSAGSAAILALRRYATAIRMRTFLNLV
jgi:hypothetical protein